MTTMRSLLCEANTAVWIWWNLQRANSRRLMFARRRAPRALSLWRRTAGRSLNPRVCARWIEASASFSERAWQTTRVFPGPCVLSAEASERVCGTIPPAGGCTALSALGSGQYAGRSMCAIAAAAATSSAASPTRAAPARTLLIAADVKQARTPRAALGASVRRDRRLRSGHARDRHPVRRAAHVVEPGHLEERDRVRVAAVLPADAEPKVGLRLAARPRREPDEPADPGPIQRLERAAVDDAPLEVTVQEPPLHVVAREPERGLRQVVRPEREEVGDARDAVGDEAGSRELDHR